MKLEKINEDRRGQIWTVMIGDVEHTFLTSNKTFARGGCTHRFSREYAVVLEGSVEYHIRGRKPRIYRKGESLSIEKNCPHYFIALEDSITLEWGASPEEKKEKHPQWRKVVDQINGAAASAGK